MQIKGTDITTSTISFTPTVGFATNGDFSPTYSIQEGTAYKVGPIIYYQLLVRFNTNAYTTASGEFQITLGSLQNASTNATIGFWEGGCPFFDTITIDASYEFVTAFVKSNSNIMVFYQVRSAGGVSVFDTGNILPSSSGIDIRVSGWYPIL